ncbi:hypothetical protein M427DRAFT_63617 [Gonapodya prolifera JEL478]|uniref:F-box domain-containing protein n=1 Tax=Gonapodya prolifera (strain JEL478) TaxID=1344416 RepID=A0A138ZYY0_GONPJ|nr:hypothetical protein M427DRAFT_63617 [Gonapodya prolifera JEL478]|eukprot:KXS09714.1 hypothetical protein M427DRAFT_63617 [Gonapodya prolifera JEL478]
MVEHRSLSDLPPEVLMAVASHLPLEGRLALSSTTSGFRHILASAVFRAITVSNLDGYDRDSFARVTSTYGGHVEHVHFRCLLFPNREPSESNSDANIPEMEISSGGADADVDGGDDEWEGESNDETDQANDAQESKRPENQLSATAVALLRGDTLPHVRSLTVEFVPESDFEGSEENKWVEDEYQVYGTIYISQAIEDMDDVAKAEKTFGWRDTMARVWRSISVNQVISVLEICTLPPNITTAWHEEWWSRFLGRLERLTIGMWGGDNGAGWKSNTTEGYLDFLERLDDYFFVHGQNMRFLHIVAHEGNPFGGSDFLLNYASWNLGVRCLPQLQHLRLQNCFHDEHLRDFLRGHMNSLESLHFINCMAPGMLEPDVSSWAEFFTVILESGPSVLKSLVVENNSVPLTHEEEFNVEPKWGNLGEPEDVRRVRERLKADPTRKLFHYAYLDDKYGMVFAGRDVIVNRFLMGEDQAAYDRLMEVVKANAARLSA